MSLFNSPSSSAPTPPPAPSSASSPVPSLAPLTEDDVKRALPSHLRSAVTPALVQSLNGIAQDPIIAQNIRDNFIGYSGILKEGKFKTEDYLHAVAYVSYKLMGYTNEESYARTFPGRYANLLARNAPKKDIAAYVSAYHKGKLVNLVMEQSLVPSWVLNQDLYQKALNVQADLMLNANSEKVRTDAANSLLTHLKKPDAVKGQISLEVSESSGMKELKDTLAQLAQQQQRLIQQGETRTIDVAAAALIDKDGAEDV